MRHQKKRHLLGRPSDQRKALLRALTTAALRHDQIETTEAKAKAVVPVIDEMITLAKRGDLHARRQVAGFVYDNDVVKRLFEEVGPRFATRNGGYARIVKTAPRRGDAAPMAIVSLEV
ncbi:MAG: 50S ribosomal protein L17 [Candidatus Sericytochromatia bacterium]|nr:50S ribosomal protein L17 [Candidatus Sericytochromatia bacterium]